jgi:hypothetical protein
MTKEEKTMKRTGSDRLVPHVWVIVLILVLCSCSSWNRSNAQLTFVQKVVDRIEVRDEPVYLTDQEIKALESSLSGQVEDMFMDEELTDDVIAYYEETTKGVNKNNVAFFRFTRDKRRHVVLIYTKNGHLFGAGGARGNAGRVGDFLR